MQRRIPALIHAVHGQQTIRDQSEGDTRVASSMGGAMCRTVLFGMAEDATMVIDFDDLGPEKVQSICRLLDAASRLGVDVLRDRLPAARVVDLFKRATTLLRSEATVVDLSTDAQSTFVVVGDTHGQLHDVLKMFDVAGYPSPTRRFIFNGDFVDRGSWGLETLIVFVCWKIVFPHDVTILRGNHESQLMTQLYGFKGELEAKYSRSEHRTIYAACKALFSMMPLAAVVGCNTMICHGGLFRTVNRKRKKSKEEIHIGTLAMLRTCSKGGVEPTGPKVAKAISDVLWSDPSNQNGLMENESRGLGLIFGPDVTSQFLEANGLRLIIRSHEGPDARQSRDGIDDMMSGFSVDHDTPNGKLVTVFSAPDYPQHQTEPERTNNRAAVVVLSAPDYDEPSPLYFDAVRPRPEATPFYDVEMFSETDVEFNDVMESETSEEIVSESKDRDPSWSPSESST